MQWDSVQNGQVFTGDRRPSMPEQNRKFLSCAHIHLLDVLCLPVPLDPGCPGWVCDVEREVVRSVTDNSLISSPWLVLAPASTSASRLLPSSCLSSDGSLNPLSQRLWKSQIGGSFTTVQSLGVSWPSYTIIFTAVSAKFTVGNGTQPGSVHTVERPGHLTLHSRCHLDSTVSSA